MEPSAAHDDAAAAELKARELALVDAGKRHDDAALDQMIAPEFRLSWPDHPNVTERQAWLTNLSVMSWDSYDIADVRVTTEGKTAIVTSKHTITNWHTPKGVLALAVSLVTDLWFKRAAGWQLASRTAERQVTQPAGGPPPSLPAVTK